MKEYKITDSITATYTARGKLKKLYAKKGSLNLSELAPVVPENEKELDKMRYKEAEQSKDFFFKKAQDKWFEFYSTSTGLTYRFSAKDGKALKEIGKYLTELTGDTDKALATWQIILQRWHLLDDFYKRNKDLAFINSQLNKILNQLKNGQQIGKTGQSSTSDAFRRSFQ